MARGPRAPSPPRVPPMTLITIIGRGHSGTRAISHTLYASNVSMGRRINPSGDLVPADAMYDACRLMARHVRWQGELRWDFTGLHSMEIDPVFIDHITTYLGTVLASQSDVKGWKIPETTLVIVPHDVAVASPKAFSPAGPADRAMKISVVILAHNALGYVFQTLRSLRRQRGVEYDVVLVDNGSGPLGGVVLALFGFLFGVETFVRSRTNRFFSAGMNMGARAAPRAATHLLLLNSDVEFQDERALATIGRVHATGATGLRAIDDHPVTIADGFCFLVDRDLFDSMGELDERFPWTRAITKLQADLLRAGFSVQAIREHRRLLVHFGGKSGTAWKAVHRKGEVAEVAAWFEGVPPVSVI